MSLVVRNTRCISCGLFVITDTTGTYNVTLNPTGYGGPNADFGDTTPYTAELFAPGVLTTATPTFTLNLLTNPPSPDSNGYYVYNIAPEAIGVEVFVSGWWKVRMTNGTDVDVYDVLVYNDIAKKVHDCVCSSKGKKVELWLDLEAAKRLFCCYQNAEAQKIITRLYREALNCDCGCS